MNGNDLTALIIVILGGSIVFSVAGYIALMKAAKDIREEDKKNK